MTKRYTPGTRVSYRPKHSRDYCPDWEFGTVVRNGANKITFVIFDQDRHPKGVYDSDLFPEFDQ